MKYISLTILLLLFSFNSCKKKEIDFRLSGNVKATNTGLNMEDVDVKVYTHSLGNKVEVLKGSTKTDASGNYKLNIERSKFETLVIKVRKNKYFNSDKIYQFDNLSTAETNKTNHIISPKSWTRFILKNSISNDVNDELKILKVSGKTDCEECCPNGNSYYHGKVDTVVYCPNDGDTYIKFYWWLNGNELHSIDSLYNTPFDTLDFSIIY